MEAELAALTRLTEHPVHPFVCAIGGAKVADKVGVFEHLLARVDAFVIGGGMANTFLAAQGIDVGTSLRDPDLDAGAAHHRDRAREGRRAAPADRRRRRRRVRRRRHRAHRRRSTQVGDADDPRHRPGQRARTPRVLRGAKTIVFNGPMGVYEKPPYQNGTRVVGEAIAEATQAGATSVVGGGDAAAAAHALGFADAMTHVSTGGGATLEFLEGKTLPGVAALETMSAVNARKPLIAGNWKMHKTVARDASPSCATLRARPLPLDAVDAVICPPFTALAAARDALAGSGIGLGAQNMCWADQGRVHRRDLAARCWSSCGVRVGRDRPLRTARAASASSTSGSTRRSRAALAHGITPIVAVGETAERARRRPRARQGLRARSAPRSPGSPAADVARCVVAYEPIWAIGTGNADSPAEAERDHGRDPRRRRGPRRRAHALRRQREARQRRRASSPSRTSTAGWSAARASTPPRSPRCSSGARNGSQPLSRRRPLVLAILDGWGSRTNAHGNAIAAADLPNWHAHPRRRYPHTLLDASGEAVGLPEGVMGNSEVGHINIGSGRVVPQGVVVIDAAIASGTLRAEPDAARVHRARAANAAARCTSGPGLATARCTARSTTSRR